ncbi:MAG: Rpn family recombination-promoting nuclease/putative transposase [Bacteroidales bacterium]|nr:Rpn family recombination-promoting nuclease/putative transposase [Bacteroidales bacterium]
MEIDQKYITPYTDFGFKYIFGDEMNKQYLLSFLNALFEGTHNIEDITYKNTEKQSSSYPSRKAIFDVYCVTDTGERFIVEMQNFFQPFFKDRMIYYSTFPIREQAKKGTDWNYKLNHVYTIGILNFVFNHEDEQVKHTAQLRDATTYEVFYDKLTFITIELPKFKKTENELVTMYDKWLFVLNNMSKLLSKPAALQERIFTTLFRHAEIERLKEDNLLAFEADISAFRDINNITEDAELKGRLEGILEGKIKGRAEGRAEGEKRKSLEIAKNLKAMNLDISAIMQATGLSKEEIEKI